MRLIFRLCFKVKLFDKFHELWRGRVSILQQVLVQVVLVVKLGNFRLFIKLDTILRTPVSTSDVLEQFELSVLSLFRAGILLSFRHVEGQSQHLFLVRGVKVQLLD